MKKIYDREEKICEFQDNSRKVVVKIGKICTNTVQTEFLSIKASKEWIPKNLWERLKIRYRLQNLASKWNTFGKLHEIWLEYYKNIQEFKIKTLKVESEIKNLEITMNKALTI